MQIEGHNIGSNEAFVIAEDALTEASYGACPVVIRHPDGVAHYRFGGD